MYRRPSPLIAIICALFLLAAQQMEFVHWIGHISADTDVVSVVDGDRDAVEKKVPAHECATCIAFATLNAASPVFVAPLPLTRVTESVPQEVAPASITRRFTPLYTARAPPVVL